MASCVYKIQVIYNSNAIDQSSNYDEYRQKNLDKFHNSISINFSCMNVIYNHGFETWAHVIQKTL